ncbi:MAG: hypothetical protein ACFFB3_17360 [Candidatus Hodarchaeota archaeon]
MKIKITFLIVYLLLALGIQSHYQMGYSAAASSMENLSNDPLILLQEDEPITGIVQMGENSSESNLTFIISFLSKIVAYDLRSNQVLWNESLGSLDGSNVFIWKIIPNSLHHEDVWGIYASLSNGTVLEVSVTGVIGWKTSLGPSPISNLGLIETPTGSNASFYIVAGGDDSQVTWLTPDGQQISNHSTATEITIMKNFGMYSLVGTRSGDIYAFNGTDVLWNQTIGLDQVLGLNLYQDVVLGYSHSHEVFFMDLHTGNLEAIHYFGRLTYDSIQVPNQEADQVYLFTASGQLIALRISISISTLWTTSELPSFATTIRSIEFTGDTEIDLVVGTTTGELLILNQSTGEAINTRQITDGQLSWTLPIYADEDTMFDLLMGTLSGELLMLLGKDLTAPKILRLESKKLAYDRYQLTIEANEPVIIDVSYGRTSVNENTMSNDTFSETHRFTLEKLEPESRYLLQVRMRDSDGNWWKSEEFEVVTGSAPPPLPIIEIGFAVLFVGALGTAGFVYYQGRQRQEALKKGIKALDNYDYVEAIRFFYKAKSSERILDVVSLLVKNPALSSQMSEIMQMEELEDYMVEIQYMLEQVQEIH